MIENSTYAQWVEGRDKWYVNTLAEMGVHPSDILSGNWQEHGISIKVDILKGE